MPDAESFLDYAVVGAAGPFRSRVAWTFDDAAGPRGVVGRVDQAGHRFDGLWAATWTMIVGDFDLDTRLCRRWDIGLGPVGPATVGGWPVPPALPPAYAGHGGTLAVSGEAIRLFDELGDW